MKICPTCQASFPQGFQYCPNDTDLLLTSEEYALRSRPATPSALPEATPPSVQSPPLAPTSSTTERKTVPLPFRQPDEKRSAGSERKATITPPVTPIEPPPAPVPPAS